MRNHFVIFFKFGPVVQEMSFKSCIIWSSGSSFVQQSGTICAIMVKGIMRNNSVKSLKIWTSGSGGHVI